ncbi:pyrroloquinoline quinone-dependent dehydrogenase [Erythrobacteraceae bacterium CFH 75059]|uniref:pyrroloquinoline quinone-dependent dehydrogenase n=1 Tax=Qipengyuania thermophila TaxID=2509361 RepID=UPI00101F4F71|nr:pyrroloquinoline quinone-dependent dehydrogenase [Qipengyuania thermophila]TCD06665.1 pyrroloquinoline quinone-dependent dehydrogenase [Erythrobacteraceae bacterium CFH 75059]
MTTADAASAPALPKARRERQRRGWRWTYLALAALLALLGLATFALGVAIVTMGGTWYYLVAGALLLAGGVLAWRDRHLPALALLGGAVVLTGIWALVEIAGKGWMPAWIIDLAGRTGLVTALVVATGLAYLFWRVPPGAAARRWALGGVAAALVAVVALLAALWERTQAPATRFALSAPVAPGAGGEAGAEWGTFGGTSANRRFSTLSQINTDTVADLEEAWTFRTRDTNEAEGRVFYSSQNTPVKIGDLLYVCTPSNQVFALDPATGEAVWQFDPQVPSRAKEPLFTAACRAVAYHDDGDPAGRDEAVSRMPAVPGVIGPVPREGSNCHRRIFVATADGRLIALDALGGYVCRSFGNGGTVDMTEGMGLRADGFASNTSGATVAGGLLILGQQVSDNQRRDAPSGVVRAWDAVTGELRWAWDALRPDPQAPLAPGAIYPRGTPNAWNVITADEGLGLAFIGTGNAGADQWGGNRTPEEDRFTDAVVAVDLATGQTRWVFTTVIHDVWDYDTGAAPMLLDVVIDGAPRRAIMQATKTGNIFLLDALTGQPLRPVERRPTPQGPAPGDWVSPWQPQSSFFPNIGGIPQREPEEIDARHAFGLSPIDAALCRISFHRHRYEGMFTPPTTEKAGMLLFPGTVGGMNWGGGGFDPVRRLLIVNNTRFPNSVVLHPREEVEDKAIGSGGSRPDQAIAPHLGTPFGVTRPTWLSVLGMPCNSPPWGFISAINIDTGELVWSKPLGTGFDTGPLGIPTRLKIPTGTPNLGGPLVTAGGVTFIAAAQDNFLRAFETATGRLLWQGRLPAGGQAGPMTYEHNGRQYVAVTATGHDRFETTPGDHVVVYALPR